MKKDPYHVSGRFLLSCLVLLLAMTATYLFGIHLERPQLFPHAKEFAIALAFGVPAMIIMLKLAGKVERPKNKIGA